MTLSINQILTNSLQTSNLNLNTTTNSYSSNSPNLSPTSSSSNSLRSVTSPLDIQNIPNESEFFILRTPRFSLSLKLLDKILYIRSDESGSKITPIRGYLCIYVKKPVRISHIQLQFNGILNIKCFPNDILPNPSSNSVKQKFESIFTQSRSWTYKPNDKVLDPDYFAKGLFTYPFQFLIPNDIPESMSNVFGSTDYSINVTVNQITNNSLTKSLISNKQYKEFLPLQVVQCETEKEEISNTSSDATSFGNWRNLLYYRIAVANRQVEIGGHLKFYIKVLPIIPHSFRVKSIKVFLDQVTEYHVGDYLNEDEKDKYHLNLSNTERILLEEIYTESLDSDIQCWEFDTKIKKNHMKFNIKENKNVKKIIDLVPTTNYIENKICHFKVSHKVKVAISVEQIPLISNDMDFDTSDIISAFTMRSRSQSVDKTLSNTRAEKADNEMIKKMAKLLPEHENPKPNVQLILESEVEVLKNESLDGKLPPPTYSDAQLEKQNVSKFDEISVKKTSLFDARSKRTQQLNFIVPPAYEEIEELSQPPPYIKNM